jgi:RNA polymerase sigma-70 factor (ECF subfamily)
VDGDSDALNTLFRRHRAVAYRVAYRLLGNEPDALDAVQDGFVNALSHLNGFGGRSSFKTWLLRIVSNAALDLGRSRRRRDTRFGGPSDDLPTAPDPREGDPDQGVLRTDLRAVLTAALNQLPAAQRQAFVLHVDGGLSYQEVADALGIAVGTVMSRLFYARQRLRETLAPHVAP